MIDGHRVVVVVPYGRRRYVEILSRYLRRDLEDGVDEVLFWRNTSDQDDLEYLSGLLGSDRRFTSRALPERAGHRHDLLSRVSPLFVELRDPNTVYVKCDDDVVFVERGALRTLVEFKLRHRHTHAIVSANAINSGPLVHIHQRLGAIRTGSVIYGYGYDEVMAHPNPIHEEFIRNYEERALDRYKAFEVYVYFYNERWSINCICWMAGDLTEDDLNGIVEAGDEQFLTEHYERRHQGRHAVVCGRALVSHFAFGPQRAHIDEPRLLRRYAEIAAREAG